MKYNLDLRKVLKNVGISAQEFAIQNNILYDDVTAFLHNEKAVPSDLIGQLYQKYGKSIFF